MDIDVALIAVTVGAVVASIFQARAIRHRERAERELVNQMRLHIAAADLLTLHQTWAKTSSQEEQLALYESFVAQLLPRVVEALGEEDRRRVREGLEQPSIVGRIRYAEKILDDAAFASAG
jgi:hypothetical protein